MEPSLKLRADRQRNRDLLIETAGAVFAERGLDVGLDEISRHAGIGLSTLYRHFPGRPALMEAAYRREVEHLVEVAASLSERASPREALPTWLRLVVSSAWAAKVTSQELSSNGRYVPSDEPIRNALFQLVDRAQEAGAIRADVSPDDVFQALAAFGHSTGSFRRLGALRLLDIFMDGLRMRSLPE